MNAVAPKVQRGRRLGLALGAWFAGGNTFDELYLSAAKALCITQTKDGGVD
jgi:hypothetical protein